ncbi:MAG: hypothetical protein JWN93_1541 [Hyphomicrobiales bacterium]|jgi:hypothetical protein|nr:hypothetical protein [Hyphomicrobiales bacterium]
MRPARFAAVMASVIVACAALSARAHAATTCTAFMETFLRSAPDIKAQFVRTVVVTRGAGDGSTEARDLVSDFNVDARLFCNAGRFLRFEAQVSARADSKLREGFFLIQEAAAMAALRWPRARAAQALHAMTAETSEYLRGSLERGDVYVSGKTERHAGRDGDLAMMWTERDRSFVVLAASE